MSDCYKTTIKKKLNRYLKKKLSEKLVEFSVLNDIVKNNYRLNVFKLVDKKC